MSRPAKVSGAAFDSRGRPLAGAFVSTIQSVRGPTSSSTSSAPGAGVQADGSFAIERVVPGEYTFSVQATNPVTGIPEAASVTITVTGEDVSGLVLNTVGSVAVSGHLRFDPDAVPPFAAADLSVGIDQTGVMSSASPRVSTVTRNDWTFEMKNVPAGPRRFRVGGLPSGWAVKAILAGGRDVTDTPLNIRGDDDVSGLDIVVTNRLTTLSGSVTDSDLPVLDYSIVAYPEDSSMWIEKSRYLATARPDQAGAFSISGLPPGRYLVIAMDYLEPGESNDPEFLEEDATRCHEGHPRRRRDGLCQSPAGEALICSHHRRLICGAARAGSQRERAPGPDHRLMPRLRMGVSRQTPSLRRGAHHEFIVPPLRLAASVVDRRLRLARRGPLHAPS